MDWFANRLIRWHQDHGRKNLPWQTQMTPYRVWISEIMLQQTQVSTAIPYFKKFIKKFPTMKSLAKADIDEVLGCWSGLGYYARARNLHQTAKIVFSEFDSKFPVSLEKLESFPGIGRSTAGALLSISLGVSSPILDGNVKRVLTRFHAVAGYPEKTAVKNTLWHLAEEHTPNANFQIYTQAIMDLGATVCVRGNPNCPSCPLQTKCKALKDDNVAAYPHKKAKLIKPIRASRFFILQNQDGEVLIEKRDRDGVWKGLWGAIHRDKTTQPKSVCEEFGINAGEIEKSVISKTFRHTFSHFHLDIEPVYISVTTSTNFQANITTRWIKPMQLLNEELVGISKADKIVFGTLLI